MDFEVLRQLLGNEIDEREEKYGLNWHGKQKSYAGKVKLIYIDPPSVPSGGTVHRRRDHRSDHAMVGGMNFLAGHRQLDPSIRSNLLSSYGE